MDVRTDHFIIPNAVFTVTLVLVALVVVWVMHFFLRRWVVHQLHAVVESMKTELPPLIVGECITRQEIEEDRRRLDELESLSRNVEKRLDLLMKKI